MVHLIPGYTPPTWSCQPPPVPMICSTTKTRRITFPALASCPFTSMRAFTTAAARMLDTPSPLPRGTCENVATSSRPPPPAPPPPPVYPVTTNAAFTNRNLSSGGNGGLMLLRSSIVTESPSSSVIVVTPVPSRWSVTLAERGDWPLSCSAMLSTQPVRSKLQGGVSLHPPTMSTRTGSSTLELDTSSVVRGLTLFMSLSAHPHHDQYHAGKSDCMDA